MAPVLKPISVLSWLDQTAPRSHRTADFNRVLFSPRLQLFITRLPSAMAACRDVVARSLLPYPAQATIRVSLLRSTEASSETQSALLYL
jgi:hypothetical protein